MHPKVKSIMKPNYVISPHSTLKEAVTKMKLHDCWMLSVGTEEKPHGVITDRDIVMHALSKGKDINIEIVQDYVTLDVFYCNAEDSLEEASKQMYENFIHRLAVKDSSGGVCGVISFASILRNHHELQAT